MKIDDYLSKRIKPLTKDEFSEKVKSLRFTENQVNDFKRDSSTQLYNLNSFYRYVTLDEIEGMMKLLIWLSYSASERDQYGKPKSKNRRNLIESMKNKCEEFIENERFYGLSSTSIESLLRTMDANLTDYIRNEELLAQMILYKNSH
jgi:hypothetical protein